jgi:hypothetical protein
LSEGPEILNGKGKKMTTEITVHNSIEFRDAVMDLNADTVPVYVRAEGHERLPFRVLLRQPMTLANLFEESCPPVNMEDFAQAMVKATKLGQNIPPLVVFTLNIPKSGNE